MTDAGYVALVDTDRNELRDRIGKARDCFDQLIRAADPHARVPRSSWTVQQVVAHVLSVAHRYQAVIEGRDFRRATSPSDAIAINQAELEAVMAPIPELADELVALAPVMDAFFDALSDDYSVEFHFGVRVSGIMTQTNWLGELAFHGHDIARAIKAPWAFDERDMLLVLRGGMEAAPALLRGGLSRDTDVCVALRLPEARPYVMHIHGGIAEIRERRPADKPDAVLRAPAMTMTQMLYGRMGPATAVRKGLFIIGGRRPWKALKLQSYFEIP